MKHALRRLPPRILLLGVTSVLVCAAASGVATTRAETRTPSAALPCALGHRAFVVGWTGNEAAATPDAELARELTLHRVPDKQLPGTWTRLPNRSSNVAMYFRGTGYAADGTRIPGHAIRGDLVYVLRQLHADNWQGSYTQWIDCPAPAKPAMALPKEGVIEVMFAPHAKLDLLSLAEECAPKYFEDPTSGFPVGWRGFAIDLPAAGRARALMVDCFQFHMGTITAAFGAGSWETPTWS